MSINYVEIEGNMTRDPEVKTIAGVKTVLNFSIAHNTRNKDDAGNWVDGEPMFFDCEYWPNDAAYWLKRLGKGVGVIVTGELKQDRWEKDGQVRSAVRIRVTSIGARWLPEIGAPAQSSPQPQSVPASKPNDYIPF